MTPPIRGFAEEEFKARVNRAQTAMSDQGLEALLMTTEPEMRYFTGFQTQFWESPTRPWFLVLPASGDPIAVIPEIGQAGMKGTWITDIRCWPAPRPEDEGISLLVDLFGELGVKRIGMPMGHETSLRMPLSDFQKLSTQLSDAAFIDAAELMRELRFVKSNAEIAKIEFACQVASTAFENLPQNLTTGMSEREACTLLRQNMIHLGADHSPYLIAGSGPGGYGDIIMGPTDRRMETGDVLIIDTGTVFDGYFCDFDRNFAFGSADEATKSAYHAVFEATEAGFETARPGARMCDISNAMWAVLERAGALGNSVGRMGHGLGMQLTEGPSVTPYDQSVLQVGSVITLEPGMEFLPGRQMVHEENIVITEEGARWLSRRATPDLPVIS